MAHHVCQCVEYFLQDSMLLTGPLTISPALGIVIDALKNRPGHEEEICWLQVALKLVQQKGLRALEYVKT
ncbi:hypothetical protein N7462_003120 [Penicillium macrosclerotiorum]|uniref:uncharacterized protein n=1 Tax=Penicillium macrosclerotiorum TaxID=303699 RepID=UPI00254947E2|nr:uncharacterized protein N7462_003120 [Penicillium macrosclerotiorum]KAJ5688728.1 hypothetical protein N7462_003120 [Penicillium macrosclerotiorum]